MLVNPLPDSMVLHRRRAHLVVWDAHMQETVAPYDLYWSRRELRTYARVSHVGTESLWLPLVELIGHWDWYCGEIAGLRVLDGWGPDGQPMPKYARVWRHPTYADPDTGARYWYSDARRLTYQMPRPMAHT